MGSLTKPWDNTKVFKISGKAARRLVQELKETHPAPTAVESNNGIEKLGNPNDGTLGDKDTASLEAIADNYTKEMTKPIIYIPD